MRGLLMDCREFNYAALGPGQTPQPAKQYTNILVTLLCVEVGDKESMIRQAQKRIIRINERTRQRSQVVIFPFAHLSGNLAPPGQALQFMELLTRQLKESGLEVETVPFGVDKEAAFSWQAPGGVSWFEFS